MMQMLYAAFLALSIIGIPAVSAQGTRTVYFTSAAAPPDTKCLNVPGTQGKRIPVQIDDCSNMYTERWQMGHSFIRLEENPNACLDAVTVDSSHRVVLSKCNSNSPSQQWKYTDTNQIKLLHKPNLCVEVPDLTSHTSVKTSPCTGAKNQNWPIVVPA